MDGALTIGKVAALAGVSRDTIRYYEQLGLLPKAARTAGGYRQYPAAVVNRLALVRSAQRFGFPLRQIAGFLRVREAGGRPCRDVRAAAHRLLVAVDQQIVELVATRAHMKRTLRRWDETLAGTPAGRQARLLDSLDAPRLPSGAAGRHTGRPRRLAY